MFEHALKHTLLPTVRKHPSIGTYSLVSVISGSWYFVTARNFLVHVSTMCTICMTPTRCRTYLAIVTTNSSRSKKYLYLLWVGLLSEYKAKHATSCKVFLYTEYMYRNFHHGGSSL